MKKIISVLVILALLVTSVVSVSADTTATASNLKIVSYNVFVDQLTDDPVYNFSLRAPRMAKVLNEYHPDSMGLQECSVEWMAYLIGNLTDYAYVGVGRENGTTDANSGEASPIFYLKDKYDLLESGTFWLSQTPDIPSYGWGADYKRVCTYAVLENKATTEKYIHINTHLDFSYEPQINSIKLIQKKIDELCGKYADIPVVATGDFNLDRAAPGYTLMVNGACSADMEDTLYCTPQDKIYNEGGTCPQITGEYDFKDKLAIDHIFISVDRFNSSSYKVMQDKVDGHRISDHYGICVELDYTPGKLVRSKDDLNKLSTIPVNYAVQGTAEVDGVMDNAYTNAQSIAINKKDSGTADTNGTAKIIYDNNYLYYFVDVNDGNITADKTEPVEGEETYGIDGVQLFFDFLNSEASDYQQDESGYINTYANGTKTIDKTSTCPSDVSYAAKKKTGGYTVEAKVALSKPLKDRLAIEDDIVIGIGIQINDDENNDGKRDGVYMNYYPVVYAWSSPTYLSKLVLKTGVNKPYRFAPGTPVSIDGVKDDIYCTSQTVEINKDSNDKIVTNMATAKANTVYDSGYIYSFIEVNDATPSSVETTSPNNYGKDSVQIFFKLSDSDYGYNTINVNGVKVETWNKERFDYTWVPVKDASGKQTGYVVECRLKINDELKTRIENGEKNIVIGSGFQINDDINDDGNRDNLCFSKGSLDSAWLGNEYYAKGILVSQHNITVGSNPAPAGHLSATGKPGDINGALDGVMDDVYKDAEIQYINKYSDDSVVTGCAIGTARVAHDNEYIYSFIEVNDATPSSVETTLQENYGKDGVQIFFKLSDSDYGYNTINVNGVTKETWNKDRFDYKWLPVKDDSGKQTGYIIECRLKMNDDLKTRIASGEKNIVIGSGFQINDDTNDDGTRDKDIYSKASLSGAWYYGASAYDKTVLAYAAQIDDGGNISVKKTASAGEVVPFTVTPNNGYKVGTIKLNGKVITGTSFIMPDKDVNLDATFIDISALSITVDKAITGGKITTDKQIAAAGDIIHVTISPDEGKALYYDEFTCNGALMYGNTFIMPESDVVLSAIFKDRPDSHAASADVVKLDGCMDDIYAKSDTVIVNKGSTNSEYGPDNRAIADVSTVYNFDEGFIYCFAEVTDKTTNKDSVRPVTDIYTHRIDGVDGVVFYFDFLNTKVPLMTDKNYPFVIGESGGFYCDLTATDNKTSDGNTFNRLIGGFANYTDKQASYVAKRTEKGYNIEMKIAMSESLKAKKGKGDVKIGMGFVVNDDKNDDGKRDRYALSFCSMYNAGTSPRHYGNMILSAPVEKIDEFTVTINQAANGTITSSAASVTSGGSIELTFTPNSSYRVKSATVNGVEVTLSNGKYTVTNVQADITVTAVFEKIEEPQPQEFTVTITPATNGTITSSAASVTSGGSIELTFTPNAGYKVKSATVNGEIVTLVDGLYMVTNVQADITVAAEFEKVEEPQPQEFTVMITQGANGTITSSAASVTSGGSIELIFTPNAGYKVKSATVNGEIVTPVDGKYTVTNVQADITVAAVFELINQGGSGGPSITYYTITAASNQGGKVSPESATVEKSGTKTFTITADEGYEISDVEVDGKSAGKVTTYTFSNIAGNHTLKAIFKKIAKPETPEYKNPFADVNESNWFYDSVMYVYNKGLMKGVSADRFIPSETGSRGMIVTILYNLEGGPEAAANSFKDVADEKWYADAIAWAAENKIVNGYGNGLFGPNDNITREQMAAIFYNYAKLKGYDLSEISPLDTFTDGNKASAWAEEALRWMVGSGMMSGKGNNILDPKGAATRAEMAVIMQKFVEKFNK